MKREGPTPAIAPFLARTIHSFPPAPPAHFIPAGIYSSTRDPKKGRSFHQLTVRSSRREGGTRRATHLSDHLEIGRRRPRKRESARDVLGHLGGLERRPVVGRDVDIERAGTWA